MRRTSLRVIATTFPMALGALMVTSPNPFTAQSIPLTVPIVEVLRLVKSLRTDEQWQAAPMTTTQVVSAVSACAGVAAICSIDATKVTREPPYIVLMVVLLLLGPRHVGTIGTDVSDLPALVALPCV